MSQSLNMIDELAGQFNTMNIQKSGTEKLSSSKGLVALEYHEVRIQYEMPGDAQNQEQVTERSMDQTGEAKAKAETENQEQVQVQVQVQMQDQILGFHDQFVFPELYNAMVELIKHQSKVFAIIETPDLGATEEQLFTELKQSIDEPFTSHCIRDSDDLNKLNDQIWNQCAIIVLTKDQTKKYMKLMETAKKNGFIALIMESKMKPEMKPEKKPEKKSEKKPEKKSETNHGKQQAQFQIPAPMYYGVFISKEEHQKVFKDSIPYTQTTPLHCTCLFVGGNRKMKIPDPVIDSVGKEFLIEVTGLSNSQSGQGFVVVRKDGFPGNPETPHITLTTNKGFKPVDVGKQITIENTTPVDTFANGPPVLRGVYAPTW